MTDQDALNWLNGRYEGGEAAVAKTYSVWVHNREVAVTLLDHGEGTGSLRYSASAIWADESVGDRPVNADGYTVGNPDSTFDMALMNLHWNVFRAED